MKTVELKSHIESMIQTYRDENKYNQSDIEQLLYLADFQELEVSKLINKFHYIVTKIARNGGIPVLKQINFMI